MVIEDRLAEPALSEDAVRRLAVWLETLHEDTDDG